MRVNDIELIAKHEARIIELRNALEDLAEIASQCDSWESFPQSAINAAYDALNQD